MTWGRLDDRLHDNGKVWSFSDRAFRVWMYSISYCNKKRKDDPEGTLTTAEALAVCRLAGAPRTIVDELLTKGGWDRTDDGYRVHDFEHYGPKADATMPTRVARHREKKRSGNGDSNADVTRYSDENVTPGNATLPYAYAQANPVPDPVPRDEDEVRRSKPAGLGAEAAPAGSAGRGKTPNRQPVGGQKRCAEVAERITAAGMTYRISARDAQAINGWRGYDPELLVKALAAAESGEWDPDFFNSNFALHFVIDRINAYTRWLVNPAGYQNGHAQAGPHHRQLSTRFGEGPMIPGEFARAAAARQVRTDDD